MLRLLLALVRPLGQIARELRTIRELYELELQQRVVDGRPAPIYRLTEKPSGKDTEVSYAGERDERPIWKRISEAWTVPDEDDG
jgi:hypothetical protein